MHYDGDTLNKGVYFSDGMWSGNVFSQPNCEKNMIPAESWGGGVNIQEGNQDGGG